MRCTKCKQALSRRQTICPNCGADMSRHIRRARNSRRFIALFLLIVIATAGLVGLNLYGRGVLNDLSLPSVREVFHFGKRSGEQTPAPAPGPADTAEPEETSAPEEGAEEMPAPAEGPAATEEPEQGEGAALTAEPEETPLPAEEQETPTAPPEPSQTAGSAVGEIPAELTPAERLAALERQNLAACGADLCDAWERIRAGLADTSERQELSRLALSVSTAGQEFLGSVTDTDMRWLDNAQMDYDRLLGDGTVSSLARLSVNGVPVVSLLRAADLPDGETVFSVPELSGTGFVFPPETGTALTPEGIRAAADALPTGEELNDLLRRCLELALKNLDTVTADSGVLEAEGILSDVTVLEAQIDEETAKRIASSVIAELRWEGSLHRALAAVAEACGLPGEERYEDFLAWLDGLDYRLSGLSLGERTLTLRVYVDEGGRICGRSILLGEELLFSAARPQDGERYGLELRILSDGALYELAGRGTVKNETVDGDFVLRRAAVTLARISVRREGGETALTVSPKEALFGDALPGQLREALQDLILDLRLTEDEPGLARLELMRRTKTLLTLTSEKSAGDDTEITLPEKTVSASDWADALTQESFEGILQNLREAGLPSGLLMSLRMELESALPEAAGGK